MNQEAPRREELDYVVIRKSTLKDYVALSGLYMEVWPNYDPGIHDITKYQIAENATRLIGAVRLATDSCYEMHLSDLVVKSKFRKQGIAAALIQVAEGQAANLGLESISLIAENDATANFYKKLGFVITTESGVLKIMTKPIVYHSPQI